MHGDIKTLKIRDVEPIMTLWVRIKARFELYTPLLTFKGSKQELKVSKQKIAFAFTFTDLYCEFVCVFLTVFQKVCHTNPSID